MAFGFVVARFGLFLRLLRSQGENVTGHGISHYLGVGLLLLGVTASGLGALQYRRYCQSLRPVDLPSPRAPVAPLVLACGLVIFGLLLTALLLA